MPATGGAVTSCAYGHGHAHTFTSMVTHARIFTAMGIPARVCAYLHGHGAQASPTRPASGFGESSANPTHSNSNVQRLGGMGTASPRDATTGAPRSSRPEGRRLRPGGVDPRGAGAGRTRQKPAGAAPDRAGRMADHAGQARRHASAWVRSLHFSTLSRIS